MKIKKSIIKDLLSDLEVIRDLNKKMSMTLNTPETRGPSEYFRGYSEGVDKVISLIKEKEVFRLKDWEDI